MRIFIADGCPLDGRRSTIMPFDLNGVFSGTDDTTIGRCTPDGGSAVIAEISAAAPLLPDTSLLIDLRTYFRFGGPGVGGRRRL